MDGDNYLRGFSSLLSSCWGCHHPSAGGDGRVVVAVVLVLVSAGPCPRHCRFRHRYQHHCVGVPIHRFIVVTDNIVSFLQKAR